MSSQYYVISHLHVMTNLLEPQMYQIHDNIHVTV